jgi:O-succinylbenzoic acid--CoA ligase
MSLQFITNNEQTIQQVASFLEEWANDLPYFESKTSGSTGNPKTIQLKKQYAIASAQATLDFLKISAGKNALLCLNSQTIGGKMMIVRSSVGKLNLFVQEPSSNPLTNITSSIDFIAIAPVQLYTILVESPEKLKKIPSIIVGGGIISEESVQLLKEHQITVFQTFGMTETISHIALRKVGFEEELYYTTLPTISVSDKNGQLCISAPSLGIEKLITNDTIEVINNRQFRWLGRTDFVINSGGVKIQIESLEEELKTQIQHNFFIYKKPDTKLGEKVILIIEGTENKHLENKSFYSFLKNKYHIPKEIAFLDKFILTVSHKINRIANFEQIDEHRFKQIL